MTRKTLLLHVLYLGWGMSPTHAPEMLLALVLAGQRPPIPADRVLQLAICRCAGMPRQLSYCFSNQTRKWMP